MQEPNNKGILKDDTIGIGLVYDCRREIRFPEIGTVEIGARVELPFGEKPKQSIEHLDRIY